MVVFSFPFTFYWFIVSGVGAHVHMYNGVYVEGGAHEHMYNGVYVEVGL